MTLSFNSTTFDEAPFILAKNNIASSFYYNDYMSYMAYLNKEQYEFLISLGLEFYKIEK
jgi:hypothetical protein